MVLACLPGVGFSQEPSRAVYTDQALVTRLVIESIDEVRSLYEELDRLDDSLIEPGYEGSLLTEPASIANHLAMMESKLAQDIGEAGARLWIELNRLLYLSKVRVTVALGDACIPWGDGSVVHAMNLYRDTINRHEDRLWVDISKMQYSADDVARNAVFPLALSGVSGVINLPSVFHRLLDREGEWRSLEDYLHRNRRNRKEWSENHQQLVEAFEKQGIEFPHESSLGLYEDAERWTQFWVHGELDTLHFMDISPMDPTATDVHTYSEESFAEQYGDQLGPWPYHALRTIWTSDRKSVTDRSQVRLIFVEKSSLREKVEHIRKELSALGDAVKIKLATVALLARINEIAWATKPQHAEREEDIIHELEQFFNTTR